MKLELAAIHIDNLSDLFALFAHMYAISEMVGIVVAVVVMVVEHIVVIDNFHLNIAYACVMVVVVVVAAEVLYDLNIGDEVIWFAVLNDTFHFGYLMPVYSALPMLVVGVVVLVQRDLDCSILMDSDDGPAADTVLCYYFDGSAEMKLNRYFDDFVDTELGSYFDGLLTDKKPVIHLVDRVPVSYLNGFVVLKSRHNYCTS